MKQSLNETLIIGWCDVSATGCRALIGCKQNFSKLDLGLKSLDVSGLDEQIKLFEEPVSVLSKTDFQQEKVTLMAVSSQLSTGACTQLVNGLFDKVSECKVKEIIVVAAVNMKVKAVKETDVFHFSINHDGDGKILPDIKTLPDKMFIKDNMLNTIIQFAKVEKTPLRCFLTQGYKIGAKKPNSFDGSKQSISNIQNVLKSLYGIDYDEEKANALDYEEIGSQNETVNAMYL